MAQTAGEHRAVDGHPDRASERPEKVRGGGGGSGLTRVDGVLDRDHQDLGDPPKADPNTTMKAAAAVREPVAPSVENSSSPAAIAASPTTGKTL